MYSLKDIIITNSNSGSNQELGLYLCNNIEVNVLLVTKSSLRHSNGLVLILKRKQIKTLIRISCWHMRETFQSNLKVMDISTSIQIQRNKHLSVQHHLVFTNHLVENMVLKHEILNEILYKPFMHICSNQNALNKYKKAIFICRLQEEVEKCSSMKMINVRTSTS